MGRNRRHRGARRFSSCSGPVALDPMVSWDDEAGHEATGHRRRRPGTNSLTRVEVRMSARWLLILGVMALAACFTSLRRSSSAAPPPRPVVRLAELQIEPARLEQYLAFLREEVETSIRVEPGVLTLYAVQSKRDPTQVRLFEMYADSSAYDAHIASAHFR